MANQDVYRRFIEYMDNPVWMFTESEWAMPMLTSFITPEEAEFMIGFPKGAKTIEEIAAIKETNVDALTPTVRRLCEKGLVYEAIRGDSVRYRLWTAMEMFVRVAHWRGEGDDALKEMSHNANKYYHDGWYDQHKDFKLQELRAIPIQETVEAGTSTRPFEDIAGILGNYEYYTVSHCACRTRYKLDPDYEDSRYPSEVCLHFDELGRYIVQNGLGREITKEETLEILKMASEAGLVHGISNVVENPDTI